MCGLYQVTIPCVGRLWIMPENYSTYILKVFRSDTPGHFTSRCSSTSVYYSLFSLLVLSSVTDSQSDQHSYFHLHMQVMRTVSSTRQIREMHK